MNRALILTIMMIAWCWGDCNFTRAQQDPNQWAQWRGPLGTGEAPNATPPVKWGEAAAGENSNGENIRWKTRLPGLGHSTPVVWDNTIFLTTAVAIGERFPPRPDTAPGAHDNLEVDSKYKFVVIAVDRDSGQIKWQTQVHEAIPHEGAHYTASLASASPSTDGKYVYAFFGTYGLYCLDFDGHLIWEKSFGTMNSKHGHGEGASPVVFGNSVIVNWDHEGDSFITSLDKTTGKEIWRVDRKEVTSWSSPIVYDHAGTPQVIVAGTSAVRSYDLKTGKVIWQCRGLSANVVATPIALRRNGLRRQQLRYPSDVCDQSRRGRGRHHGDRASRLASSRANSLCSVAVAVSRLALLPAALPGDSVGRGCQNGRGIHGTVSDQRIARHLRVSGGRRRKDLYYGSRRHHDCDFATRSPQAVVG